MIHRYMIISAPNSSDPHRECSGFQVQKMTSATDSQPTPERDASIQTQPAVVMVKTIPPTAEIPPPTMVAIYL